MVRAILLVYPSKCQGSVFGNPVLVLKKKIIMVVEDRKVIYFINQALQTFTFFSVELTVIKNS
jgi:hypothetical protein